jgi:hypothetical protein
MRNYYLLASLLILTGCSSVGYQTASHNGKLYYIPPQCEKYSYSYSDPDTLYCYHKGVATGGVITPADSDQIENYRIQQEANRQALANLNESLKNSTPKTTNTNCYNYGYAVNCTSNTY